MKPRSKQRIIFYLILSAATFNPISTVQKMKETTDLATFTEHILNGKLHILLYAAKGVIFWLCSNRKTASNCLTQAVNGMETKKIVRNHNATKCFSFCEKHISDFTTMFCSTISFFNTLILSV